MLNLNEKNRVDNTTIETIPFDSVMMPKLQKVLADAGVGSRRDMDALIKAGSVTVNDQLAYTGQRVLTTDIIQINGKIVQRKYTNKPPRIILYHKMAGEIVSHSDPDGRTSIFEKMPRLRNGKWLSVGRLDYNTEGLLIICNSGELTNRMMHPRFGLEREYAVRILGDLSDEMKQTLCTGVQLEDGIAKFLDLSDLGGEGANKWYKVILTEGKNREVRRLFEAVGVVVSRLIRTRFGPIHLPNRLKRGQMQALDDTASAQLMVMMGVWKDTDNKTMVNLSNDLHWQNTHLSSNSRNSRRNRSIEAKRLQMQQNILHNAVDNKPSNKNKDTQTIHHTVSLKPSYPTQITAHTLDKPNTHFNEEYQPNSYGGAVYTPEHNTAGHTRLFAHTLNKPKKYTKYKDSTLRFTRRANNQTNNSHAKQEYVHTLTQMATANKLDIKPKSDQIKHFELKKRNKNKIYNTSRFEEKAQLPLSNRFNLNGVAHYTHTKNLSNLNKKTGIRNANNANKVKFDRMTPESNTHHLDRMTTSSIVQKKRFNPTVTVLKKRKLISEDKE